MRGRGRSGRDCSAKPHLSAMLASTLNRMAWNRGFRFGSLLAIPGLDHHHGLTNAEFLFNLFCPLRMRSFETRIIGRELAGIINCFEALFPIPQFVHTFAALHEEIGHILRSRLGTQIATVVKVNFGPQLWQLDVVRIGIISDAFTRTFHVEAVWGNPKIRNPAISN